MSAHDEPIPPGTRVQIVDRFDPDPPSLEGEYDILEASVYTALGLERPAKPVAPPPPPVFGVVRKCVDPATGRYNVAHMSAYKFAIYNRDELIPCPVRDPCPRCKGQGVNHVLDLWTCSWCRGTGEHVRPILTCWQRLVSDEPWVQIVDPDR